MQVVIQTLSDKLKVQRDEMYQLEVKLLAYQQAHAYLYSTLDAEQKKVWLRGYNEVMDILGEGGDE